MGIVICDICNRSFNSKQAHKYHQSHHDDQKFQCNDCGKQFSQKSNLTTHIKGVHTNVKHKCDQCGREYYNKVSLYSHIKSAHENKKYHCTMCDYQAKETT